MVHICAQRICLSLPAVAWTGITDCTSPTCPAWTDLALCPHGCRPSRPRGESVSASYSGSIAAFLASDIQRLVARLALEDARRFRRNETQQVRAWEVTISTLRRALENWPAAAEWRILLEFPMRRLGRRI